MHGRLRFQLRRGNSLSSVGTKIVCISNDKVKGEVEMNEEKIAAYFAEGIDCGQVTLLALSDSLGISEEEAQKLGAALGAGMFQGEQCGAFLAGVIAIGLKYGHADTMRAEALHKAKAETMAALSAYRTAFEKQFGGTCCEKLLGYKIPEEMPEAIESGRMMSFCPKLVEKNIAILKELFQK